MERQRAIRRVLATSSIAKKSFSSSGCVAVTSGFGVGAVAEEGECPDGRVTDTDRIGKEGPVTNGSIGRTASVVKESERSIGGVSNRGGVKQERSGPSSGIFVPRVNKQGWRAHVRVEVALGDAVR